MFPKIQKVSPYFFHKIHGNSQMDLNGHSQMDFSIQLAYQLSSESKYHNNSLILLSPFRSSARVHMGYCLVEETESTI